MSYHCSLIQPYKSLSEFAESTKTTLPQGHWRLVHRQVGHIHGLPKSWGHLTATNGVLCAIEQGGGRVYIGHLENFIQFKDEEAATMAAPLHSKKQQVFAEF